MADLATMTQRIVEELPRNASNEEDRIWRAIVDSINFYKFHHFGFNEATDTFSTVADQQAYTRGAGASNFPSDYLSAKTLYVDISGSWNPIDQKPIGEIRYRTATDESTGYPDLWAFHNDTIYFSPIPHTAETIRLDYVKEIGVPVATYSGGWSFEDEDGNTLDGSYTNEWFTEDAEELIRLHSEINLVEVNFKNPGHAQLLRQREKEIYKNLKHKKALEKSDMTRTTNL